MLSDELAEAAAWPIGTRRKWKIGYVIKVGPDKWVPEGSAEAKKVKARSQLKSTIGKLRATIARGKIEPGMTFREHVRLAKQERAAQEKTLRPLLDKMAKLAPNGEVFGRTKTIESILGKMARKPGEYKKASDLTDVTGTRITHKSIGEVMKTADEIRKSFDVVEEEDAITKPKGDYRSIHFLIKDTDGKKKEIQVRTQNQNRFADWAHDHYKPASVDQDTQIKKNKDVIAAYSRAMSEFMYAQDRGDSPPPPDPPPCPEKVKEILGCL